MDILMVPIGGTYTVDIQGAAKIVHQLEPRIVIALHYRLPGVTIKLEGVDGFLKEVGAAKKQPVDKLTVKKKDLIQKETEIVVMKI